MVDETAVAGVRPTAERGGVTVWTAGILAAVVILAGVATRVAAEGALRGRAQAVADLVALAAVDGGRDAAGAVATANGAALLRCSCDRLPVQVQIGLDGRLADAAASCQGCGAPSP